MSTHTVTLTEEEEEFLRDMMAQGQYWTPQAVLKDALGLMRQHQDRLRAEVGKGLADVEAGRFTEFEGAEAFVSYLDDLVERYVAPAKR